MRKHRDDQNAAQKKETKKKHGGPGAEAEGTLPREIREKFGTPWKDSEMKVKAGAYA